MPPTVAEIIRTLQQAGHKAFLVGGCVRDLILKVIPKDWDIATSATPDQVLALFAGAKLVGESFGVVRIPIEYTGILLPGPEDPDHVEVATFRKDGVYSDGRRPDTVEFTTSAQEDSYRRDFTMNAMLYDPFNTWNHNADLPGLLDFHHGLRDLRKGIIRCVGAPYNRFREDYLRMLRAVRFATRFNFWIDIATSAGIKEYAPKIADMAPERIQAELNGMIATGRFYFALRTMEELGLLYHIFPELGALRHCEQPKIYHPEGDVWTHTMLAMQALMDSDQYGADVLTNYGVLFHDLGKPSTIACDNGKISFKGHEEAGSEMVVQVLQRLHYPNDVIAGVAWLVKSHMRLYTIQEMRSGKALRFMATEHFERLMDLGRCDCEGSSQEFAPLGAWIRERQKLHPPDQTRTITPLVTGHDLIAAGMKPGPSFKTILDEILNAQLEGNISTREEGLALAIKVVNQR